MPYSIAVANLKGGTGKTTTAVNLACGLAQIGVPTLLVELDPFGDIAEWLQIEPKLSRWFHKLPVSVPLARSNLWVLASNSELAPLLWEEWPREELIDFWTWEGEWQLIIFDCPPSISRFVIGALELCDGIILPLSARFLDIWRLDIQLEIFDLLRAGNENQEPLIGRLLILPTFFDVRESRSWDSLEILIKYFGEPLKELLGPPIRSNVYLTESPIFHQSIFEYKPRSSGAEDYSQLVNFIRTDWLKWQIRIGKTKAEQERKLRNEIARRLKGQLYRASSRFHIHFRFDNLEWSREELVDHLQQELISLEWVCPSCGRDLHRGFEIDHRIPLRIACTQKQFIQLFAPENLTILCRTCNRSKGGKLIPLDN